MEEHVDRKIDRITEGSVNPGSEPGGAIVADGRNTRNLQKSINGNTCRKCERGIKKSPPQCFGCHDRRYDKKIYEEMRDGHPTIHALVVTPKTLERICAKGIRKPDHKHEYGKSCQNPRPARSVLGIEERQCQPCARHDLDNNPKREILSCYVGKEERLGYDERNECKRKYSAKNEPAQCLLEYHARHSIIILVSTSAIVLPARDHPQAVRYLLHRKLHMRLRQRHRRVSKTVCGSDASKRGTLLPSSAGSCRRFCPHGS